MKAMELGRLAARLGAGMAGLFLGLAVAHAQDIIEAWESIDIPAPPKISAVSVEPATTALLVLDMYATSCNAEQRPSCVDTIPRVSGLLEKARARDMLVIYAAGPVERNGPSEPTPELARLPGEQTVRGPADKFAGSDLQSMLASAGIETVIVVGTSADGAVLYTGSSAAMRQYRVVIPVDALSSKNRFAELYTVWHLANTTGTVSRNVVLSRSDLISFQ